MSDTRDLTTGEAEAYRRGFSDARERAAKWHDDMAIAAHRGTGGKARHEWMAETIRAFAPEPRGEATGLEYRGG